MKLLRFFFEAIDGDECGVDIFAMVKYPEEVWDRHNLAAQIEDAVNSYCDSVEYWQFEELVDDVLKSFNLDYEIVDPITFCI